jgi:hypothetical protein
MRSANEVLHRSGRFSCLNPSIFRLCIGILIVGFMSATAYAASAGNTQITLRSTSTANDQVQQFYLTFNHIDLISQSGRTLPLLSGPLFAEFLHVNGGAEVLASAQIPQGLYTGISASFGPSTFTCNELGSTGGLVSSSFAYGYVPESNVAIELPSPILVGGSSLLLYFNLNVSKSARYSACNQTPSQNYSINPTFEVTAVNLPSRPTSFLNGKLTEQEGVIDAIDSDRNGFRVTAGDGASDCCDDPAKGPQWQVRVDAHTVMQGFESVAELSPGLPVDMDAEVQEDGSLLATRIGVHDSNPTNLSASWGPVGFISDAEPMLADFETEALGFLGHESGFPYFSFGKAEFKVSGQFANLRDLPFPATFTASNRVPGQNVSITSHATAILGGPIYVPAKTVTLMPQILNGRILSMGKSGGFDTYTIQLASYDLFPALAHQPGQVTLLKTPARVVVYVGDSTEMLNSDALHLGSVFRFTGLVFNDRGTLRMDCSRILDGVSE